MKPIGNGRTVHESSAVAIATFQVWPHCACFPEHPILIDHRDKSVFNEGSDTKGPLTWSSITSDTSKLNCFVCLAKWEFNGYQLAKPAAKKASFLESWRNRGSLLQTFHFRRNIFT